MKINKLATATIASMLMLSGCASTSHSKVVDGKDALSSVNEQYYLADDAYNDLINSSNAAKNLYQIFLQKLFEKEAPVTKDMKTEADVLIKDIKSNYSGKEEELQNQLSQMGYRDLNSYKEGYIEFLQYSAFVDQYITNHFDEIFEDYYNVASPRYVSHILVKMTDPDNPTEEESAKLKEVQDLLAAGKSFEDVATEYSDDTTASNQGSLGLCDKNTSFVTAFKEAMLKLNEGEVSEPIKTEYGYHIIKVTSTNKDQMKEELNKSGSALRDWTSSTYYDSYLEYVIYDSYEITYNDETIKNLVENYVQSALKERESSRTSN